MSNRVVNAYLFPNGMVCAFDADGKQVPEYQGTKESALPKLQADYPDLEVFGAVIEEQPKLTAEELMEIASKASKDILAAFIPAYVDASRTVLRAVMRAKAEGMSPRLAIAALEVFVDNLDEVSASIETQLDKLAKEEGFDFNDD